MRVKLLIIFSLKKNFSTTNHIMNKGLIWKIDLLVSIFNLLFLLDDLRLTMVILLVWIVQLNVRKMVQTERVSTSD